MKIRKSVKLRKIGEVDKNQVVADAFGDEYSARFEELKLLSNQQEITKTRIKVYADKNGKKMGKSVVIVGKKWVVGFSIAEYKPTINLDKVKKTLRPALVERCSKTIRVIDEKAIMDLVQSGAISKKEFLKLLDTKPASERVLVKTVGQYYADKDSFTS